MRTYLRWTVARSRNVLDLDLGLGLCEMFEPLRRFCVVGVTGRNPKFWADRPRNVFGDLVSYVS